MTPEELQIIAQLVSGGKTLSDFQDKPAAPAAPPPDLAAPYNAQATKYNTQADSVEKDMATPYPEPHSVKENIVAGIRSGMQDFGRLGVPGGSTGQEALRRKQFDDQNAQRLDRVKSLRSGAQAQQDLGQRATYQASEAADRAGNLKVNQDAETRLQKQSNRPVIDNNSPGTSSFARDVNSGMPIDGTTVTNPAKATAPTGVAAEYEYAVKNGYKGSFSAYQNEDANRKNPTEKAPKVVSAQATINGKAVIGTLNTETNVFTPAHTAGDPSKAPVENNSGGNANSRAGTNATVDLVSAERLRNTMHDTLARIESGKSSAPGADDMVLLSNHIAMTMGSVKGARTGRDIIEAHKDAISLDQRLSRAVETVLNGGQLTPDQRREFVALADRRVAEMQQSKQDMEDYFSGGSLPAAPGGGFVKPGGALEKLLGH